MNINRRTFLWFTASATAAVAVTPLDALVPSAAPLRHMVEFSIEVAAPGVYRLCVDGRDAMSFTMAKDGALEWATIEGGITGRDFSIVGPGEITRQSLVWSENGEYYSRSRDGTITAFRM